MQNLIFTYYSEESSDRFISSIKSIASNLKSSKSFELAIIAKRQVPANILKSISQYFLTVTQIRPSGRVVDFSKDISTEVIVQYREYNRWYVNPNVILTSELEDQDEVNVFYQNSDSTISTNLFFIKGGSILPQIITKLIDARPLAIPSYELRSSDLSFVIANNFLIQKKIPHKKLLIGDALADSSLAYNDVSNFLGLDTTSCFGSKYSNLNQTISSILQKQKKTLPKITRKTSAKSQIDEASKLEIPKETTFGAFTRDPNRVSVIMTNYNCEHLIERAIKSVLSQTHSNLELIIVDDASTDNSMQVITKLANEDDRIRVFRNISQRGTYWSKNSVIHKTTGSFITMIDSDDYDVPTKLEKQVAKFNSADIVCVTCLNDRKVSEFSNVSERVSMGYPSMMFRYEVFKALGHYDTVKFGADSEFYDRAILEFGRHRFRRISEVLQISPRRTNGLTGIIPEMSQPRIEYVKNYTKWHSSTGSRYLEFPQKVRKFPIPIASEVPYTDLSNSVVVKTKSTKTLPVIMCVWKRIDGFLTIVNQLNSQRFKNFKLFIWNNNPDLTKNFLDILKKAEFEYEFHESSENIGGFARFYYAKKIRRNPDLLDHCVFIDDDQTFGSDLLGTFIREAKPNTILAQWGWEFTQLQYYGEASRKQRLPGETLHYAGTGGMVADMRVFDSEGLFDCPKEYWFVEDLWLSFYANHNLGFDLFKSAAIVKNGDDIHSLYRVVKDVKTPMLVDLIKNYGWDILPKDKSLTAQSTTTTTLAETTTTTTEPIKVSPAPIIEIEANSSPSHKVIRFLSKIIKM